MDKLVIRVAEQNLTKIKELINQGYDLNTPYNEHSWTPFTLAVAQKFQVSFIIEFQSAGYLQISIKSSISMGQVILADTCLCLSWLIVVSIFVWFKD